MLSVKATGVCAPALAYVTVYLIELSEIISAKDIWNPNGVSPKKL